MSNETSCSSSGNFEISLSINDSNTYISQRPALDWIVGTTYSVSRHIHSSYLIKIGLSFFIRFVPEILQSSNWNSIDDYVRDQFGGSIVHQHSIQE